MKLVVIKSYLKEGLSAVAGVAAENINLPILKNVLLEALQGKITLIATNLEIAISYVVSGKVIEDGKVCVNAGVFLNVVNSLSSERLNVDGSENLQIQTENYEGKILGSSAEEFPIIPKIKNTDEYIEIKSELLKEAFLQIIPAAETRDIRPELNAAVFKYTVEEITIAATDSFRLSERIIANTQFDGTFDETFQMLIPGKTVAEVVRIMKPNEKVRIFRDKNQVMFKTEQWECISRLVEGNFPDYSAIVPQSYECQIVIEKEELLNAIKVANVVGGKSNEVLVKILKGKKAVEIFSADKAIGENTSVLSAKIEGDAEKIVFNGRYLSEGLKTLKEGSVFIGLNGDRPAILKGQKDDSHFYLLAPVLNS